MKAILDTHLFIWMDSEPEKVPETVLSYLTDPDCEILLSVGSVWEVFIKTANHKLEMTTDIEALVEHHLRETELQLLPIDYRHVLRIRNLPSIHKDPFDRILVAQALAEDAVLLTDDKYIRQYPVRTDW